MTKDEARRNFVKNVYTPYKVEAYNSKDIPEDERAEDFYALLPAGVYAILGEDDFLEVLSQFPIYTYTKDGSPLGEHEHYNGIYVSYLNVYGIPYLEYEDPEIDGVLYKFIPISGNEFPRNVLDTLQDDSPLVESAVQIVRSYIDDAIKDYCASKSPLDLYKYVDSKFFYEFFTDVVNWARAITPAH